VNLNGTALSRAASILSNTVLLAANSFLIASNLKNNMAERRRSRVVENLQLTAEVASAVAGLTKVVTENLDKYHADTKDIQS
jgi:hypothetical protein|tara:strand:- start:235 stop:480 length:246 start_codon:yes stop_codon:yes gene_type:complete